MGSGRYSFSASVDRSTAYSSMSDTEIFTARTIDVKMKPDNIIRECRDSADHPETIPVIIALDVTGSMGYIPSKFVREEMNTMMAKLYESKLEDAQVLFMGIGDHECDKAPIQVGQFESDDQLLDQWLKSIYLEGGGGGNDGESYLLAWYFAAKMVVADAWEKRGKKGFLFTIGDENNLKSLPVSAQERIFGRNGSYKAVSDMELYKEACEKYDVYHLHVLETRSGSTKSVQDGWKQNLGDNAIMVPSYKEISTTIANIIKEKSSVITTVEKTEKIEKEEIIL